MGGKNKTSHIFILLRLLDRYADYIFNIYVSTMIPYVKKPTNTDLNRIRIKTSRFAMKCSDT